MVRFLAGRSPSSARSARPGQLRLHAKPKGRKMFGRGAQGGAGRGQGRKPWVHVGEPSAEELALAEERAARKRQREAEDAELVAKEAAAKQARLAKEALETEERLKARNPLLTPAGCHARPSAPCKTKPPQL